MPTFSLPMLLRAILMWMLFILAESAQGALRQALTSPELGSVVRQVSVFAGAAILFGITWLSVGWMRSGTALGARGGGLLWVAMTLVFEIGVGRLLGFSWERLLADYDLLQGGLMPLGLLAMALTPWTVRWLKTRRRASNRRPADS